MKVERDFFGMMFQGSSFDLEGNSTQPFFPIPVGVQRLWDTYAVMTFMGLGPDFNMDGMNSQVRLAERNRSKVLYCFGFSAHWIEHPEAVETMPPAGALLPGSKNEPTSAYLASVAAAVMDFSVGEKDDHARRIHIIQQWNEPAVASHYGDTSTPELCHLRSAGLNNYCKSRDSGVLMLSPSFTALDQHYGLDYLQKYVNSMRARGNGCDAFSVHLYTDQKLPHAEQIKQIHTTINNLDRIAGDLGLDYYFTEFNGPWEAYDIMARHPKIKCLVLNGQQREPHWPTPPYESAEQADRWTQMYNRLTTVGPSPNVPAPDIKKRGGCF